MEEQLSPSLRSPNAIVAPTARDTALVEHVSEFHGRIPYRSTTLRDLAVVLFRHRLLLISSFLTIFLGVVLGTWILPKRYETQMKILVKGERADPLTTPASSSQSYPAQELTLEDLNSEVELIKSRDLLERVVVTCGLHTEKASTILGRWLERVSSNGGAASGRDLRIPKAVLGLEKALVVEVMPKSKLIEVRYTSRDPYLAAKVLETVSALYLEKHLAVHRPAGALDFFKQQTEQYKKDLSAAEQRLSQFSQKRGVVSIEIERDITLRKLSDFEMQLREARTAEAALEQRIKSLEAQAATTPQRVVTQVRNSDNQYLMQQLQSTLLSLELKRTELLVKYEPGYRGVQEVETQIAQTKEAIAQAEKSAARDETTDLDRTRQWLDEELARARAELVTVKARSSEIAKSVELYRGSASQIIRKDIEHQGLARGAKTAEENYLMYLRKQEEGRISDALDRKRILNVAIAEAATVPAIPSSPRWGFNLIIGFVLALLASLGVTFAVDFMDPTFRTPVEVESYLGLPVLAATPRAQ